MNILCWQDVPEDILFDTTKNNFVGHFSHSVGHLSANVMNKLFIGGLWFQRTFISHYDYDVSEPKYLLKMNKACIKGRFSYMFLVHMTIWQYLLTWFYVKPRRD